MSKIKEQIAALKCEIRHIRGPIKSKGDEWKETADQWIFIFDGSITSDYWCGIGHREERKGLFSMDREDYKRLKDATLTDHGLKIFVGITKPKPPKLDDLLSSLAMDSRAENESFKSWCSDFGSSDDSISALNTYRACQEAGEKLRKLGFRDLEALREHYQDY